MKVRYQRPLLLLLLTLLLLSLACRAGGRLRQPPDNDAAPAITTPLPNSAETDPLGAELEGLLEQLLSESEQNPIRQLDE